MGRDQVDAANLRPDDIHSASVSLCSVVLTTALTLFVVELNGNLTC